MIVVLSLNTALDRTLVVPGLSAGGVFRAERASVAAGGKGINVARVARQLGAPVRIAGFLGGMPETFVWERCTEMGIEQHWTRIAGETRTCVIAVDPQAGTQTVLNEPGPRVTRNEIDRLMSSLAGSVGAGDLLCISGSAPPGVPDEVYADVIRSAQGRGARVLIDASGSALRAGLGASPWAATPNVEECASAIGDGDPRTMARRLSEYAEHAILTLGEEGLLYAHRGAVHAIRPPRVQTVNAVGSGDALVAGFLTGIERGIPAAEALRLGVACGAANASRLEPGIGSPEDLASLLAATQLIAP